MSKFVVAWNYTQQVFSVETLEEHLKANQMAFKHNTTAAFAMLGLFNTHEEASEFCLTFQEIRNQRLDKN